MRTTPNNPTLGFKWPQLSKLRNPPTGTINASLKRYLHCASNVLLSAACISSLSEWRESPITCPVSVNGLVSLFCYSPHPAHFICHSPPIAMLSHVPAFLISSLPSCFCVQFVCDKHLSSISDHPHSFFLFTSTIILASPFDFFFWMKTMVMIMSLDLCNSYSKDAVILSLALKVNIDASNQILFPFLRQR